MTPLIVSVSASGKTSEPPVPLEKRAAAIEKPIHSDQQQEKQTASSSSTSSAASAGAAPRQQLRASTGRQLQQQQKYTLEEIMRAMGVHPDVQKQKEQEREQQQRRSQFANVYSGSNDSCGGPSYPSAGGYHPFYPQQHQFPFHQHYSSPFFPPSPPTPPPSAAGDYSHDRYPIFPPAPAPSYAEEDDEPEMPYSFPPFFGKGKGGNVSARKQQSSQTDHGVSSDNQDGLIAVQVGTTTDGRPIVAMLPRSSAGGGGKSQQGIKKSSAAEIQTHVPVPKVEKEKHHVADYAHLKDCYIGIDLGACNAHVAVYDQGHITVLTNEEGNRSTPSWIVFDPESEQIYHGDAAKTTYSIAFPQSTVFDYLLLLNKKLSDPWVQRHAHYWPFKLVEGPVSGSGNNDSLSIAERDVAIQVIHNGKTRIVTIEELLEIQLRALKAMAVKFLENEVTSAVISTSCLTDSLQRETLRKISERVGFQHVRFYFSPSIALSNPRYIMNHLVESKILVVDAGADRVNVAVATVNHGLVEVLHVGGIQWEQSLTSTMMEYFLTQVKEEYGIALERDPRIMLALRHECEKAKLRLVTNEVCELELHNPSEETQSFFKASFSRGQLDLLAKNNLLQSIACVDRVLKECGLKHQGSNALGGVQSIDEVVFIGGHSHMKRFQLLLSHYVHNDLCDHVHRREGVVTGCAGQGSILAGRHWIDALSLDTILTVNSTNYAFSVETMEGVCKEIIPVSTHLPCSKSLILATTVDNQTEMLVQLYEGNARLAQDNKLIYQMLLEGLLPLPRGRNKIEVHLDIDSDYTLSVKIISLLSEEREVLYEAKDISLQGFQRITQEEMSDIDKKRVIALSHYTSNNHSNPHALIPLPGANDAMKLFQPLYVGPPTTAGSASSNASNKSRSSYGNKAAGGGPVKVSTAPPYQSQPEQEAQQAFQNWWAQQVQQQRHQHPAYDVVPPFGSRQPFKRSLNTCGPLQQAKKQSVGATHGKAMTVRDPYTGHPITVFIDEEEPMEHHHHLDEDFMYPGGNRRSFGQRSYGQHAQGHHVPTSLEKPSAETQAHPLYQFLQSKLSPYQLPEHEIHSAYNVLMDEAIPSSALLQEIPHDQFQEALSSRNLKKGVEVALRKIHNDLFHNQQPGPMGASGFGQTSHASVASSSATKPAGFGFAGSVGGAGGDRIVAMEKRLAGLEDKINKLTELLLAKNSF